MGRYLHIIVLVVMRMADGFKANIVGSNAADKKRCVCVFVCMCMYVRVCVCARARACVCVVALAQNINI